MMNIHLKIMFLLHNLAHMLFLIAHRVLNLQKIVCQKGLCVQNFWYSKTLIFQHLMSNNLIILNLLIQVIVTVIESMVCLKKIRLPFFLMGFLMCMHDMFTTCLSMTQMLLTMLFVMFSRSIYCIFGFG